MDKEQRSWRAPRGMRDVLPEEVPVWRHLEETAARLARQRGFREIRPVLLEETSLFTRSVGEVTDIVEKEMFSLQRGDTSLSLRPEGTAGIVRAYVQAGYAKRDPIQKLFHIGPMFRYERPQKGRDRMFTQFDVEALGSLDPRLDAEVIQLAVRFFQELGLTGTEVRVNSMGDGDDRDRFRAAVRSHLVPFVGELCDLCQARFERSVMRVLDCKNPACKQVVERSGAGGVHMLEFLSPENRAHIDVVQRCLGELDVEYVLDGQLVRGLDYYTRTVFEVHVPALGARSAVCGGGRYDHLVAELGGPDLGAVGFAIGFSSTLIALEELGLLTERTDPATDVYVVAADEAGQAAVLPLAEQLRAVGISAVFDHGERGVKAQMKQAGKGGFRAAIIVGTTELESGEFQLKDLARNEQRGVPRDELIEAVRSLLGTAG